MKELHVGRNQGAAVDEIDFEWANLYTWELVGGRQSSHIRRSTNEGGKTGLLSLGSEIMKRAGYTKELDEYVTFIDGNRLNFQRNNLVFIEKSLYHQRQPITHKWKGVRYIDRLKKFSITIKLDRRFTKSTYQSSMEAAECYNKLAISYYGQFAAINNTRTSQVIWPPLILMSDRKIRKPVCSYRVKSVIINAAFDDIGRWCPRCINESCYLSNQGLTCLICKWSLIK